MKTISDSSPLISLAAISCFQVLEVFFKKIYIPLHYRTLFLRVNLAKLKIQGVLGFSN